MLHAQQYVSRTCLVCPASLQDGRPAGEGALAWACFWLVVLTLCVLSTTASHVVRTRV